MHRSTLVTKITASTWVVLNRTWKANHNYEPRHCETFNQLYSRGVRRLKYLLCAHESPCEVWSINSLRPLAPKCGLLKEKQIVFSDAIVPVYFEEYFQRITICKSLSLLLQESASNIKRNDLRFRLRSIVDSPE